MIEPNESVQKVVGFLESIPNDYMKPIKREPYYNMAATLTDSILQAGVNYKSVVYPRICKILTQFSEYRSTCDFIILFQTIPISEIIQWKNKKKQNTICELAWFLYNRNINTENDLANWIIDDNNSNGLLSIQGIGKKTIDYLKLLSGLQAIPIDRHMFRFLKLAGILTDNYEEASTILRKTAATLKVEASILDNMIWQYMSKNY